MKVKFSSLDDVREFVSLATLQPYEVSVVDGERVVSADSFMEMFTINFTHPLEVAVDGTENVGRFAKAAARFIVA